MRKWKAIALCVAMVLDFIYVCVRERWSVCAKKSNIKCDKRLGEEENLAAQRRPSQKSK